MENFFFNLNFHKIADRKKIFKVYVKDDKENIYFCNK